jgi:hypothetical protein
MKYLLTIIAILSTLPASAVNVPPSWGRDYIASYSAKWKSVNVNDLAKLAVDKSGHIKVMEYLAIGTSPNLMATGFVLKSGAVKAKGTLTVNQFSGEIQIDSIVKKIQISGVIHKAKPSTLLISGQVTGKIMVNRPIN